MGERGPERLTAEQLSRRGSRHAKKREAQERATRAAGMMDEPLTKEQILVGPFTGESTCEKAEWFWQSHAQELADVDILTRRTYMGFTMLCGVWQDHQDAVGLVHEHGEFIEGSRGQKKENPAIRIREKAFDQFVKLAIQFGIVPQ